MGVNIRGGGGLELDRIGGDLGGRLVATLDHALAPTDLPRNIVQSPYQN